MPDAIPLAGYLVSAVLGGGFTYLAQNFMRLLNEDVAQLNDHLKDIDRIEEAAVNYWLSDACHESIEEIALRGRLLGSLKASSCFREEATRLLGQQRLRRYKEYDGNIFDVATGGTFETVKRAQDIGTATEVIEFCHLMRSEIRAARRDIFWFR